MSSRRGYLLPGVIAFAFLLLLALVANFMMFQQSVPDRLNGPDTARLVAEQLQAARGAQAPPKVHCPASEPLRAGVHFTCTASGPGWHQTFLVTESNAHGTLLVKPAP